MHFRKWIYKGLGSLIALGALLAIVVWSITFHPTAIQKEHIVCPDSAPSLQAGQMLKILSWNVQFMAGTDKRFFWEVKKGEPFDAQPSREDIERTLKEVARVIREENPDLILLQEVDDGAKRTYYEDQLQRLLTLLNQDYRCHASTFYWKAKFVPHPNILGSVGMKLSTLSKYKMDTAIRHSLALIPENFVRQQFNLKRAVLEVRIPVGSSVLAVMNTHLAAMAHRTNILDQQTVQLKKIIEERSQEEVAWILGGDFNMRAPGKAYREREREKAGELHLNEENNIKYFYDRFQAVPSLANVNGPDWRRWFTSFKKQSRKLEETIDYLFLSKDLGLLKYDVRYGDTESISDHMLLTAEIKLPY